MATVWNWHAWHQHSGSRTYRQRAQCLRNPALHVVRESEQQILQIRKSVAHVQCAKISLTHELMRHGMQDEISQRDSARTEAHARLPSRCPY